MQKNLLLLLLWGLGLVQNQSLFAQKRQTALQPISETSTRFYSDSLNFAEIFQQKTSLGQWQTHKFSQTPASVTIISQADIRQTPARNLLDLLELYVPNASWLNETSGASLGIRGISGWGNVNFILLVNGININQKSSRGAITELENWNLDDIERIEVIRGANSAVYGAGAQSAVINLVTKNAHSPAGTRVSLQTAGAYNSNGLSISHITQNDDFKFYAYGSVNQTRGANADIYGTELLNENPATGFIGKDFPLDNPLNRPALRYLRDFDGLPQFKFHTGLSWGKGWDLSARYTQSGRSIMGVQFTQSAPQINFQLDSVVNDQNGFPIYYRSPVFGELSELSMNRQRQITLALQKQHIFENGWQLNTRLSGYSLDFQQRVNEFYTYPFTEKLPIKQILMDKTHPIYLRRNFAETEINFRSVLQMPFNEKYQASVGVEYAYNQIGKAWGKDARSLRLGEVGNIFSDSSSYYFQLRNYSDFFYNFSGLRPNYYLVGNGWNTQTISAFGELNMNFSPFLRVLLNVRADKNNFSDLALSPRLALISELNENNVLKLIAQQAKRILPYEFLWMQKQQNQARFTENLNAIELIYNRLWNKNFLSNLSIYFNQTENLHWNERLAQTEKKGTTNFIGAEWEMRYRTPDLQVGFVYGFTQALNTVSYQVSEPIRGLDDFLEDPNVRVTYQFIQNLPNQSLKLWLRKSVWQNRLSFHADLRGVWAFRDSKKEFDRHFAEISEFQNEDGFFEDAEYQRFINKMRAQKFYQADFRFNLSASLQVNEKMTLQVFAMNLIDFTGNKRYLNYGGQMITRINAPILDDLDFDPSGILNLEAQTLVREPRFIGAKLMVGF
jgi:hypothetical protein